MTALAPKLTVLDERVLAGLSPDCGCRATHVAELAVGIPYWHCTACGRDALVGEATRREWKDGALIWCRACLSSANWDVKAAGYTMRPIRRAMPEQVAEVREVLRGLERVGLASCRGGWWRRV